MFIGYWWKSQGKHYKEDQKLGGVIKIKWILYRIELVWPGFVTSEKGLVEDLSTRQ
jgi:hypothetical protein